MIIEKLPAEKIKEPGVLLPKVVTYETPTKKVSILVQVVEEGVIQALGSPYKGGSGLHTTDVKKGTLGVNTTYKGQYCLLSAAHVLTRFNCDNLGKVDMTTEFIHNRCNNGKL